MGEFYIGKYFLRTLFVALACIVSLGTFVPTSFANDPGDAGFYDLILEVKRDRKTLSSAIIGLEKEGEYFLPVAELARILQFKADTDLTTGVVSGFFINEANTYSLNAREGTYILKGETRSFPPDQALIIERGFGVGDIYVTPEIINQIWPLALDLNHLLQSLEIRTDRQLPYQIAAERDRKRNKNLRKHRKNDQEDPGFPVLDNGYKWISLPALDLDSAIRWQGPENQLSETLSVSGRQDLLKTEASYNFKFQRDGGDGIDFEDSRFLLTRKAYDNELPLGVKRVDAGDIRPQASRLIKGTLKGRGFSLSTRPLKRSRDFDTITIEGLAQPGWEVELYRGQELISFQAVGDTGEFRFEDVTVNYGTTVFRTVLYGPQGQIEEAEKTYNISGNMLTPGETIFEASVLDFDEDLIPTDNDNNKVNPAEGVAQNYRVERGINENLSALASFTDMPTREGDHRYATLGFNVSMLGALGSVEGYKDLSGGSALDLRALGKKAGINLNARASFLKDFESDYAGFGDMAQTFRGEAGAAKSFKLPFGTLGLRFNIRHDKFKSNTSRTELDATQSYSRQNLSLTHNITTNLLNHDRKNTKGDLNATYKINPKWQLRSYLNYDIFPEWDFRNIFGELRYRDGNRFTAALDLKHNMQNQQTSVGGQVGYDFDTVRTSLDVDWDKNQGIRSVLRANLSLAPYGKDQDYIVSSQRLSNKTAINTRVFLDRDMNGKFGEGDEVLEGVKVDIGGRKSDHSDETGNARYIGSDKSEYENITIDRDTFNNPFFVPIEGGYRTVLRAGTATSLDFPVIETGFIEGSVFINDEPFSGVRVQLLSDSGELISIAMTAYDGLFSFEEVRPGSYIVQIDPSYEQINVPPRLVSVTSEDLYQYNIDLQILEQAEEAACTETPEAQSDGRITQICQNASPSVPSGAIQPAQLFDYSRAHSVVKRVRIGEHPDKVRFVLDLSAPAGFYIPPQTDPQNLTVELPGVAWDAIESWFAKTPYIIGGFDVGGLNEGGTKLVIHGVDDMRVLHQATLVPNGPKGHRIYIDLVKDKKP